jgi:translation initiation factor 1
VKLHRTRRRILARSGSWDAWFCAVRRRRPPPHRGGKVVVVVDDFATHLPMSVIEKLAKKLRAACGCGGTCRGRAIELQGDQPAKVRELLEAEGFKVAGVR